MSQQEQETSRDNSESIKVYNEWIDGLSHIVMSDVPVDKKKAALEILFGQGVDVTRIHQGSSRHEDSL